MSTPNRGNRFDRGRTGVLLVHGLGGTPIEMRYVALALSRAGHSVSVPQLAGHCATDDQKIASRDAVTESAAGCGLPEQG